MPKTLIFQAIQFSQRILFQRFKFSISIFFVYTQLIVKIVLFQTIQFSVRTQFEYQNISILNNSVCWRNKDELISDVLLWTPAYGQAKAGRPARRYMQRLCEDTGCSPEDQPKAMNDREKWRERVRDIRASGTIY